MKRFRARYDPDRVVQAVQWHGESNCAEVHRFLGIPHAEDDECHEVIHLPEPRDEVAMPGDWIILDPDGVSFYRLSPAVFAVAYRPVE